MLPTFKNMLRRHPSLLLGASIATALALGTVGGVTAQITGIGSEGFLLPPGQDLFDSDAIMDLDLDGTTDPVMLNGPAVILRDTNRRDVVGMRTIDTEILQLDLRGTSPLFGPVQVTLSPESRSQGMIQGQADPDGDVLYPADSFFDVFFEINFPDQGKTLHNTEPVHLMGQASDENLPDDEHSSSTSVPLVDENGDQQGQIVSVRWVPKPPLERKVSRVVVKKLNKVIRYVLDIQTGEPPPPPPPSEILIASKSLTVVVPGKTDRFVVGAASEFDPTPNVLVENPFRRDANVKICVDATRLLKGPRHVVFALDVAGDGDFRVHSFLDAKDIMRMKNTCFVVATREFQVIVQNKGNDDVPVELAIIWTTGPVIP